MHWIAPSEKHTSNAALEMRRSFICNFPSASLAATFRKRAASGLQSGRGFVLPDAKEQVHEKTDLELLTWLVIKEEK